MADAVPRRPGPKPHAPRDGDKVQARQRVNVEVRCGRLPHPNTRRCKDCSHEWEPGERRHEYDHHMGYAPEHHYDVEPVCTTCHAKRDSKRKAQTECLRGHAYDTENTYLAANGTRHCRACQRVHDAKRAPRGSAHWAKVNAKRRGAARG